MLTHRIQNKNYYLVQELVKSDTIFFKKCMTRVRDILTVHKIPKANYIYCNKRNGSDWMPIAGTNPGSKDKLFITKQWCINNVPKLLKNQEKAMTLYEHLPLPPLCEISDDELFYDNDYYYYVEIRGKRTVKECYFSAEDIANILGIKYINTNIAQLFIEHVDYEKFSVSNLYCKQKTNTKYFFTYQELLKFIFKSKSSYAQIFIEWATNTLFTLHIGSTEQKTELINSQLGTDFKLFKQVMSCHPGKISCVYLISLGTVADLKDTFSIKDEKDANIVCKYGRTNDIDRRMTELSNEYKKKNKKISLSLQTFSFIDDVFSSKAEKEMADIFSSDYHKLENITENELICVNKKQISNISRLYRTLENDYGREYEKIRAEYVKKDSIKERKIIDLEKTIMEKEMTIMEREKTIMEREKETVKREKTIMEREKETVKREKTIMEREKTIMEKDSIITEKDLFIERLQTKNTEMRMKSKINKLTSQLAKVI
jgi:hypothetical protein